jgi:molybdate transport system substrate-binding protein
VSSGDAEAGLVYVTDVLAAGSSVHGITFPGASSAVNVYPIATVKGSKHATTAAQFLSFVTGSIGQSVLASDGFAKP